jgi:P-type conjugative transfer protein TrbJ
MTRPAVRWLLAAAASVALLAALTAGAHAQRTVYDPWNHAENVLQAARALQQIQNQVVSLQNEAQMLLNQARNLTSLPVSTLASIQHSLDRTSTLLGQAERIAYDVGAIDRAFADRYGAAGAAGPESELVANARARWQDSVAAFRHAMGVQATAVESLPRTAADASDLVTASQAAVGALQAVQAGNQLLAVQSQQLFQLTALLAAQSRAQAIEQSRQLATEQQAQEQFQRFIAPQRDYQPYPARLFHK